MNNSAHKTGFIASMLTVMRKEWLDFYRDRMGVKTPFLERELLEEYAQQIGLE